MHIRTARFSIARTLWLLLPIGALGQKPAAPAGVPPNLPPGVYAVIHTSMGTITAELYDKETPNTVRNFVGLARGTQPWLDPKTRKMVTRPLYDNLLFHRVIPGFMIQTGDPTATGSHNCGYVLKDEIVAGLRFDRPGRLAMANVGQPNTGACQFFITEEAYPSLNGGYTIFGQVVDGQKVVTKIAHVIRDSNDKPSFPVKLIHIDVMRLVAAPTLTQSGSGSGIVVNAAGDILTAAQTVEGCTELRLADSTKLLASVVDKQNGLAVLHSGKPANVFATFRAGDGVPAQQPVWTVERSSRRMVTGAVGATADSHGDTRFVQVAAPAPGGNTGDPLLDTSGHLAGILSGKVEDAEQARLAVKASVVMGFLDSSGVAYSAAASDTPANPEAASQGAGAFTLEIQCWK